MPIGLQIQRVIGLREEVLAVVPKVWTGGNVPQQPTCVLGLLHRIVAQTKEGRHVHPVGNQDA